MAMWFFWYIGNYGFLGDAAAGIGVTGVIAGLIALLGPRASRLPLEQVSR
jgi:hypothetical protein